MTATMKAAAPQSDRIEALDFVRGVALFGILLMNITSFGLIGQAYIDPTVMGGAEGADLWAWIVAQVGFEGTQRALFSILFGAGVILFTSRLEAAGRADSADLYFRRNLWLIVFGCFNGFILLWYGDILYAYGITALFVFAFRKLAGRTLLWLGIAALAAGAAWSAAENASLLAAHRAHQAVAAAKAEGRQPTEGQKRAAQEWEMELAEAKPDPAEIRRAVEEKTSGYLSAFHHTVPLNTWFQSWFMYRYFSDIFGMMLIGMGLFRLGVLTLERPARIYWTMTAAGYSVGIAVNILETLWIIDRNFSVIAFSQAEISYDVGRLAMTMGHLGALLLFVRSGALPRLRRAMAAVGRMALTNYLSHSLICAIFFVGFGFYGRLARHELYYVVLAIWAFQLVASPLWLRHFRFGPVEWLWRALTYGQRPAMRRRPPELEALPAAA